MDPALLAIAKSVGETNEQLAGILAKLNDSPSSVMVPVETQEQIRKGLALPGQDVGQVPDAIQRRLLLAEEMDEVREKLQTKSVRELHTIFAKQAAKRDAGIPLYDWLASGGTALQTRFDGGIQNEVEPHIAKAIDTSTATALIRQDLEPILYEIFVRVFPIFDRLNRKPANGLVHAYNQMTSYGDADWIGELDTVTDDRGTYVRQTTNIGILATRRGVSLKSQFAVLAGGAGFNPERLELQAGLRAMASRYQKTILMGNWSDATGTLTNELGPYDDDSFDGLRKVLNSGSAVNVDPATNPDTTGAIRRAINRAVLPITEAGGSPSAIYASSTEQITFDEQQEEKERIIVTAGGAGGDLTVGQRVTAVKTIDGVLPMYGVRGGALSSYTATGTYSGNTVRDIYVGDEEALSIPHLGPAGPTVLEIPIGVTGQLTHLFIVFFMGGLEVAVPSWWNKVRVKVA